MPERLYLTDAYLRSCEATVTGRHEGCVELDRTVLVAHSHDYGHPQASDKGLLRFDGHTFRVKEVTLAGDRIFHYLEGPPPLRGTRVRCEVDFFRRFAIMRLHTVAHAVLALAEPAFGLKPKLIASRSPEVDVFSVFVLFEAGTGARARAADLARGVTKALSRPRDVTVSWVPRAQAEARADAPRLRLGRVPRRHDPLRFVEIDGLGDLPCDGTVVANTRDIGRVVVRGVRVLKSGVKVSLGLEDLAPPAPVPTR